MVVTDDEERPEGEFRKPLPPDGRRRKFSLFLPKKRPRLESDSSTSSMGEDTPRRNNFYYGKELSVFLIVYCHLASKHKPFGQP